MKSGFTLIEIVLATGLIAILSVSVALMLFSTLRGSKKANVVAAAKTEGAYALTAITSKLMFARSVRCLDGGINLQASDSANVLTTFNWNGSALSRTEAGARTALTSPQTVVTTCAGLPIFTCTIDATATSAFVDVCFNIDVSSAVNGGVNDSGRVNFPSRITIRNFGN